MRILGILLIICALYSCNFISSKNPAVTVKVSTDSVADLSVLKQRIITCASDYSTILNQLDKGNLKSIEVAATLFQNSKTDSLARDSMFAEFDRFLILISDQYIENNEKVSGQLNQTTKQDQVNTLKKLFSSNGLNLYSSEGSFYLEPLQEHLLLQFGPGLSNAWNEYLRLRIIEQQLKFAEDGSIMIPSDSLASRIIQYEKFMTKHPNFVNIQMARDQYNQYLEAYFTGMDNSKIFDEKTNLLNDRSKKSFEDFINNYPDNTSSLLVKSYLELLKTTDFNYTDKVDSFLMEKIFKN